MPLMNLKGVGVDKVHRISMASGPIRAIVMCSCGWKHEESRRQNALGRASKMRGAANAHLKAMKEKTA